MSVNLDPATLAALHKATVAIAAEANLDAILEHIVRAARNLVGARYGALGVANENGRLITFINSGMSPEDRAQLDHLPEGHGLLGALISHPASIRLNDLGQDPRSVGFPDHHPPMTGFLGVPLVADGQPVGNLYLTDKVASDGRLTPFTADDQQVVEMLAAHAAQAVVRARALAAAERWSRQMMAVNQAARAIAGELALDPVLQLIVDTARELGEAEYAALGLPNAKGEFELFIFSGLAAEVAAHMGDLPIGLGLLGYVTQAQESVRTTDIAAHPKATGFPAGHPPMASFLGVPILIGGQALGNLYLTNKKNGQPFSAEDETLVGLLAAHAAVAIQNARLYEQVEQLAVLSERNRIGMDLHDGVIQSIYAVGLTLESLRLVVDETDEADQLLNHAQTGLDGAIQDIRNFIMDLRPRHFQGELGQGLQQLVREFQANTMTPVALTLPGETTAWPHQIARTFFLTTQEALANIARHAHAGNVAIELQATTLEATLTIRDDGLGFNPTANPQRVGHGLSNMRARAHDLAGQFQIESQPSQGTRLVLTLPLP